ncbi:muscle, skeletal receptor tyrosine protein kinase-like isoform X2 [Antedon mediterranea]|uniref:muscle, skeletal receptor tyrosine protein kinase-like isoform X2 n=1 Tax=Antedon mediterranea TaxID=105859 RepID=UPI003AF50454
MDHLGWICILLILNVTRPISCDGGASPGPVKSLTTQATQIDSGVKTPDKKNGTPGPGDSQPAGVYISEMPNLSSPVFVKHPENNTEIVLAGQNITYHCQVAESPEVIEIWWEHNGERILTSRKRRREKLKLSLSNVTLENSGKYECLARNNYGTVKSDMVLLTVNMPATIIKGPGFNNVEYGKKVNLTCDVIGYPKPKIAWKERGSFKMDYSTGKSYDKPYLIVTAVGPINYTCVAENKIQIGSIKKRSYVEKVGVIKISNRPTPQGYCNSYQGQVCGTYLQDLFIFYNTSIANPERVIETSMLEIFRSLVSVTDKCYEPILKLICHRAHPDCDQVMPGLQLSKPICREECYAVKLMYCRNDWKQFVDSLSVNHKQFFQIPEDCGELPSKFNTKDGEMQCSDADILQKCYNSSGQYYQGSVNYTKSGKPCKAWDSQTFMNPGVYPELYNASNHCRNPDGRYESPWCFTDNVMPRWEFCAIGKCDSDEVVNELPMPHPTNRLPFDISWIVIICCTSLVVIVIIIISVTGILHVKRNKKLDKLYPFPTNLDMAEIPPNPMYGKDFYKSFNPRLETFEYPRNNVVYIKDIGEGAFGRVFQAQAPSLVHGKKETIVAVKMLKDDADADTMRYFNREAEVVTRFNHQNIVKLLGVCFVGKPLAIILEYMGHGDLQHFLRRRSPERIYEGSNKSGMVLDMRTKLNMAKQVATGMAYLTELRFVHRDVATRNCLVNNTLEVKISDFGLARHLGSREYYLGHKDEKIPIRWTSPEALWDYQFTCQSDMWSFGILLWEIFTNALKPYSGMSHEDVFMKVRQGYRLGCPKDTPKGVYELMKMCWAHEASQRPLFQTVYAVLEELQKEPSVQQASNYAIV